MMERNTFVFQCQLLRWACLPIVLFVLMSWPGKAQRIVPFDPITGDTIEFGQDLPSYVQFRVEGLTPPSATPNSANFPDWNYYWTFGDCKIPSLARQPKHIYDLSNLNQTSFRVKLILTGIYSDDEDIDPLYYPDEGSQFNVFQSPETHFVPAPLLPKPGREAGIVSIREPSPGKLVTYLLPYQNRQLFSTTNGEIRIEYPDEFLIPALDIIETCGFSAQSSNNTGLMSEIVYDFENLSGIESRCIRANFRSPEDAPVGVMFPVYVTYSDFQGGSSRDTLYSTIVDSQDPNEKLVAEKNVCPNEVLNYIVNFENFGNGPANLVTIVDCIDTLLELKYLTTTGHSLDPNSQITTVDNIPIDNTFNPNLIAPAMTPALVPQITLIKDSLNAKVAWIFHDINLPPIDSNGNTGFVTYSVPLKATATSNWDIFGQRASIYFDDNDAITTQAPLSQIRPCYCEPAAGNDDRFFIERVILNNETQSSRNGNAYQLFLSDRFLLKKHGKNEIEASFHAPRSNQLPVFWQVWLDANRDGDFSSNEKLGHGEGSTINLNFFLPNSTITGRAMLRIAAQTGSYPTACSLIHYGEIEDYEVTIESGTQGDLKALLPKLELPVLLPGQTNTVVGRCVNKGPASISGSEMAYYLSDDAFFSSSDFQLGTTQMGTILSGDTLVDSSQVFVPDTFSGVHYLLLVLDPNDSIAENQENNNERGRQVLVGPMLPDLSIRSAFVCEPTIRSNTSLTIYCRVANTGPSRVPLNSGAKLGVYVSVGPAFDGNVIPMDTVPLPDLLPQAGTHVKSKVVVSNFGYLPPGTYYVHLKVDHTDGLSEINEKNNVVTIPVEIASNGYYRLPYRSGFECGGLDKAWATGPVANSIVWDDPNLAFERRHCALLGAPAGSTGMGQLDLHLLLDSGQTDLDFYWLAAGPVNKTSDGLFLSTNQGSSFHKVYSFPANSPGVTPWTHFQARLDTLDTNLGDTVIIRWQFQDNASGTVQGLAIDRVQVLSSPLPGSLRKGVASPKPGGQLASVFPNPFRESATIHYRVPESAPTVSIQLHDALGKSLPTLFNRAAHPPGNHQFFFQPQHLPPGMYYCTVRIGERSETHKLVLMQ